MSVGPRDPVFTNYRILLAYGLVGILICVGGLIEFAHFEPFSNAHIKAQVVGVFHYDPDLHKTSGPDRQVFARGESFAAVVSWSGLPETITVQAVWYDSFENVVGGAGPGRPSQLGTETVIPASVPEGLKYHLPGEYLFTIEHIAGGLPVEVLARRLIYVDRA